MMLKEQNATDRTYVPQFQENPVQEKGNEKKVQQSDDESVPKRKTRSILRNNAWNKKDRIAEWN